MRPSETGHIGRPEGAKVGQQRRDLTPDAGPLHLLGAELRAWRDRAGLSLRELAGQVRYDASHLGKIERAQKRQPDRNVIAACDAQLGAGGALIRLLDMAQRQRQGSHEAGFRGHEANGGADEANAVPLVAAAFSQPSPWDESEAVTVPAFTPDGRTVYVSISRRAMLRNLGGAAIGAMLPVGGLASPAAAAPDHPVEHFANMRRLLADNDNMFGPGRVLSVVHEQLGIVHRLRQQRAGADRAGLLRVQVEFADLAGWLHQDAGDQRAAQYWLDRALEWSHLCGDRESTAFILARKAQLAGDMGAPADVVDIAATAAGLVGSRSRFAAIAATYAGHGHALRGDQVASLNSYDQAYATLDNMEPDGSPWGQFFDRAYVDAQRAYSLIELGKHSAAAESFELALAALPAGFHRDRGVYLARAALAHAGGDAPEQAATRGLQALNVASETASGRIITTLTQLDSATARWRSLPAVANFHDALTTFRQAA